MAEFRSPEVVPNAVTAKFYGLFFKSLANKEVDVEFVEQPVGADQLDTLFLRLHRQLLSEC